jgi:hypothetical protein
VTVLVRHDPGCKFARLENGGHSDTAKRVSDNYNLHMVCLGPGFHGVIAVSLNDGSSDGELYPDRATAVRFQRGNERNFAYIRLIAPSMTVCEAESVMRWQEQAAKLAPAQLEDPNGGLEVIPRLTLEGLDSQIEAMKTGRPIALGKGR